MSEENINKEPEKNPEENQAQNPAENTGAQNLPLPATEPEKPFPPPKVLEAVVDPKEKPKEGPTPFSFTSPKALHSDMGKDTKGDAAQKTEEPAQKKLTLEELDAEIARDSKAKTDYTIDDYKDTAEMFIEGWEATLIFAARAFSKDTSDSAYGFPKTTKEKLIHQATKVSRKRNWVMPIEALFLGTLLPATGTILLKASDKRKEYMAKKRTEEAAGAKSEVNKGGPFKGETKRRGPGRPSK